MASVLKLTRWFEARPRPLTGAPAVRRLKTYSAQSGYVYQYYYEGWRPAPHSATEFVFAVTSDRKTSLPVSVFLSDAAVEQWQKKHGRTLSGTERYAIAKMSLFQAFDERADPARINDDITVDPAAVESILAALEIQ